MVVGAGGDGFLLLVRKLDQLLAIPDRYRRRLGRVLRLRRFGRLPAVARWLALALRSGGGCAGSLGGGRQRARATGNDARDVARYAPGRDAERLRHDRAHAGQVAERLAQIRRLGGGLEVRMMEPEGPACAVLPGPQAERVGPQLDAAQDLPGVHEHRQPIASRRAEWRVPVVEQPDL